MGAIGTASSPRTLTRGEWHLLGMLARTPSDPRCTHELIVDSGLHTADEMLRELRTRGLVNAGRVKGAGHQLWWTATASGLTTHERREHVQRTLHRLERHLAPRLGSVGLAYAMRFARWRLGLLYYQPKRPVYSRAPVWELIEKLVDAGVDAATNGR